MNVVGRQSLSLVARNVVRAGLGSREINIVAGELCNSFSARSGIVLNTRVQVLISIQSMILCDEPYLNEPSWASDGGTPQSLTCTSPATPL